MEMEKWRSKALPMFVVFGALFILSVFFAGTAASAEKVDWPKGDITFVIAYQPGGGYDLIARATAQSIEKYLPKRANVVVKNVPGAGTRLGTRELYRAKPDGLTVGIFDPVALAVMQAGGQVEWLDCRKLSWLARLASLPDIMVVSAKTGIKTPKEMKGKTLRFGAVDDATNLRCALLVRSIGAGLQLVHYSGVGEKALALMRGDLDVSSTNWGTGMRDVNGSEGKIIPVLVSSPVPGLNVPSAKELGIDLDEMIMIHDYTMALPPGTTPEIRRSWEETLSKVFKDQDWIEKMNKLGYQAAPFLGKEKLDTLVSSIMERMEKYKSILATLK